MGSIMIKRLVVGDVSTNCYLAVNTQTGDSVIIDPGDAAGRLIRSIEDSGSRLCGILLTHGHFDHILAVDDIKTRFNVPVYALKAEEELLKDTVVNLSGQYGIPCRIQADVLLDDGETFSLAGFSIKALHTPGHTRGSCCYWIPEENVLFSGDTLFRRSVGRTDFPGGSMPEMVRSLHRLIEELPGQTRVYPGHEGATTMEEEARYNPFV